ncbi:hypothetical protein METBIDRAFT_31968 [Metschnikowia bicuspidata var. bicuspidata NRRL YB-4993]|uniref:MIF4G domain-containing protein n=1 Tax=Metschnikowia bicuspidata var. bicuspidata NRRL YB-4993 TaxID=869754 RepID=A0A1A0HC48_9ASCO|nr:hypothetical protein METBIDRAFT_31968 [Metschnikowia bicuspidata var. bicuspidata NRRL YB-4993]OBA21452.1 hypothetical protein METBIDRAFT_31968 [Metschnikowia bicuspidata var. bicuspidata NRRL YB-4993]
MSDKPEAPHAPDHPLAPAPQQPLLHPAKPLPPAGPSAAASGAGHRQNHQGGSGNKPYHNKRGNYNGKAGNGAGHSPGGNQYASAYNPYSQNMYSGNYYYGFPYPPAMVPGMGGMPAAYPPQLPQPAQSFPASPSIAKVKITDKDGKQVDLEEKTKSSSSTPKPAAAQIVVPAQEAPAPVAAPSPAAAAATAKSVAAEEFRKKIMEKAQLAKKKKDEEKALLEAEARAKEAAAAPQPEPPAAKPVDAPAVETPAETAEPAKAAEPAETADAEPAEAAKTADADAAAEPASTVETDAAADAAPAVSAPQETLSAVESAKESLVEASEASKPEAEAAADLPITDSLAKSNTEHETETETADGDIAPQEHEGPEETAEEQTQDDEEKEHTSEGPVFDLSLYFERVNNAQRIEDPFSFSYAYPLTGPDARWKSETKKYRYDPQFLLQFGEYVQFPIDDAWKEKLENLGIVSSRRMPGGNQRMSSSRQNSQMLGGRFNGSMPSRLGQFNDRQNSRSGSRRRGGGGGASSSSGPRDRSLRNKTQSRRRESEEPPKPAEEVKPLVPSANRWVPRSKAKKDEVKLALDGSVLLDSEDIERKINSALNKLTLEMFEPITNDMLAIGKQSIWEDDAKTIKQVISLTFAKACDEPYWSSVYAQFCAKMSKELTDDVKDVNTLNKNGEPATGGDLARRILLATCQVQYEKGWVDKLPTNEDGSPLEPEMMSEEYYVMAAAKRRGLGLVKFIGNLYILNMLNDQVILRCLRDQSKNVTDPSEDSLENLAQLIKTVGPRFEASERNRAALSMVYDNIQQILDHCELSSRIKFMLMDLQDLKKSNWKSLKKDAGPKTIKEIHNEAELKKIEEGRAQAEKRRQNRGGNRDSGFGGGDSRSNSSRSGSSWGNRKDSRPPAKDSRGFTSVSRVQSNRNAPEPSAPSSNLAPREASKRTDSMASNIFAALGGDHDEEETEAPAK